MKYNMTFDRMTKAEADTLLAQSTHRSHVDLMDVQRWYP